MISHLFKAYVYKKKMNIGDSTIFFFFDITMFNLFGFNYKISDV
jgi:hypothetical protein